MSFIMASLEEGSDSPDVVGEAAVDADPGKGALNDTALWLDAETGVGALYDLDRARGGCGDAGPW